MKIWQRYLFFRLVKSFLFVLVSIFLLFVFLDLATLSGKFFGKNLFPGFDTAQYYFYQFSHYLSFFFPLSLLLASIQVLLDLNHHNELVALQMGGLSRKKLLLPFFLLASILLTLQLANYEWVQPKASASASAYVKTYARHKKKAFRTHLRTLTLQDGSEIVFQNFDAEKKELFDVFWLETESKIWHIKFFEIESQIAKFIDCFERSNDFWTRSLRLDKMKLPKILIDQIQAFEPFVPYDQRPLSQLCFQAKTKSADRPKLLSHLLYKLSLSSLLFLPLLAITPICFSFSRSLSGFKILSLSLFGLLAAMMLLDGLLVLGENRVLPTTLAFGSPLLICFVVCFRRFARI